MDLADVENDPVRSPLIWMDAIKFPREQRRNVMDRAIASSTILVLIVFLTLGVTFSSSEAYGNPCGNDAIAAIEEVLDVEVTSVSDRGGVTTMGGIGITRSGCGVETDDMELSVMEVDGEAEEAWQHLSEAAEEEAEKDAAWTDPLAETDLHERAEAVAVEDDELFLKDEDKTWYFGFGTFGDDPEDADRRRMVEVADRVFANEAVDEESVCEHMTPVLDRIFGVEGDVPNPSRGHAGTQDTHYTYRECDLDVEDSDLELEVGIGDEELYDFWLDGSSVGASPQFIDAEIGDGVLEWGDRLVVRVDEDVLIVSGRTDDEDMEPEELLPLAEALEALMGD